jgi:hypothetical protein
MNTSGPAFKSCSNELQQKIMAWSEQLDTILDEALTERVDSQWLLAELMERKVVTFRKVQAWNAFLHEEAKGNNYTVCTFLISFCACCLLISGFYKL